MKATLWIREDVWIRPGRLVRQFSEKNVFEHQNG